MPLLGNHDLTYEGDLVWRSAATGEVFDGNDPAAIGRLGKRMRKGIVEDPAGLYRSFPMIVLAGKCFVSVQHPISFDTGEEDADEIKAVYSMHPEKEPLTSFVVSRNEGETQEQFEKRADAAIEKMRKQIDEAIDEMNAKNPEVEKLLRTAPELAALVHCIRLAL